MTWAMVAILAAGFGLACAIDGRATLRKIRKALTEFMDGPPVPRKVPGAGSEPTELSATADLARRTFGGPSQ